jgi:hypothetical protein
MSLHPHLAADPPLNRNCGRDYLPLIWRHKVNPATPGEINAGCDKKVA